MGVKESVDTVEAGEQRQKIKRVARDLFAQRGLRDVTVREIALAAGQRNMGVVGYYFGTKESLAAEILVDGAIEIEKQRMALLDAMEAGGGPHTIVEAVEAIVRPSASCSDQSVNGSNFNRFLLQVSLNMPGFVDRTLDGRWNQGFQRCLKHLRRLMSPMTLAEKNRRFVFLQGYLTSLLATREAMMSDTSRMHPTWRSAATLEDIIITAAAILAAPIAG